MSEQALRQEIAELRVRIEQVDDWAAGVHQLLLDVLPHLLRGHPSVEKVRAALQRSDDRYEQLIADPAGEETPELYEPAKMMNRLFGTLGVWPGVDPLDSAQEAIDRAREGAIRPLKP